jgi:hypothetical protein
MECYLYPVTPQADHAPQSNQVALTLCVDINLGLPHFPAVQLALQLLVHAACLIVPDPRLTAGTYCPDELHILQRW